MNLLKHILHICCKDLQFSLLSLKIVMESLSLIYSTASSECLVGTVTKPCSNVLDELFSVEYIGIVTNLLVYPTSYKTSLLFMTFTIGIVLKVRKFLL